MSTDATEAPRWPELHRVRRAVVVVDVVESVRLMQQHEDDVIDRWRRFVHEVRTAVLPAHGGRMVKSLGDGMLLVFNAAPPAVRAAVALQHRAEAANLHRTERMDMRCGVHLTEVVEDEVDVYGAGVNLAARLCTLARPGEVVISAAVRDGMVPGLDPDFEDMGECYLKHIEQAVRAFRIAPDGAPLRPADRLHDGWGHRPSVAIIPFQTSAAPSMVQVVGDLLADGLIAGFARSHQLAVLSRLSSASLRDRHPLPWSELSQLGIAYLVTGSAQVMGDRLAVLCELAETRSGEVVWTDRFTGSVGELMVQESALLESMQAALERALVRIEVRRARTLPLPTLESHALQLGAIEMMHRCGRQDFDRVGDMLDHLIDRHGRVASPHAWRAKWLMLRLTRGLVGDASTEARAALEHTQRAVDADPECAMALAVEGMIHCQFRRDLGRAMSTLERATQIGPNEALAWLFKGVVHAFKDEGVDAHHCAERALSLAPIDPMRYFFDSLAAASVLAAGAHERAIELAQRSLRVNADHSSTYRTLAIAQMCSGQVEAARATVQRLLSVEPGFTVARFRARVPEGVLAARFAAALTEAGVPTE